MKRPAILVSEIFGFSLPPTNSCVFSTSSTIRKMFALQEAPDTIYMIKELLQIFHL